MFGREEEPLCIINDTMELRDCIGKWTYSEEGGCYCLEHVVYTPVPQAPRYQQMNIYVPEEYLNPDGTLKDGAKGNYTTQTAPFIFENNSAGYAQMEQEGLSGGRSNPRQFLERGMVYVNCGCRGKESKAEDGTFVGKAPVTLVDLKTAVRFLKHNREALPGQVDRMVSIGWSAGGAMSSLLGVTGDNARYEQLLRDNGAFMEESDAMYAAQVYCPIIDLEHADAAYEWQFLGQTDFEPSPFAPGGSMNAFETALSAQLSRDYVEYFNGLQLRHPKTGEALRFGVDGRSGSAYEYLLKALSDSATVYFTKWSAGEIQADYRIEDYISGNYEYEVIDKERMFQESGMRREHTAPENADEAAGAAEGKGETEFEGFGQRLKMMGPPKMKTVQGDDKRAWLSWDGRTAKVSSLDGFEKFHRPRMKRCTSFDYLNRKSGENQVFGNEMTDYMHFSAMTAGSIAKLADAFPEECAAYQEAFREDFADEGLKDRVYLLNPYHFIGTEEECKMAEHFRIHVGGCDADTSFLMSLILSVKLQNAGCKDVLYHIIWDQPHSEADYKGECGDWIDGIFSGKNQTPKRPGDFEGPERTRHVVKRERYDLDIKSYFRDWKYFEEFHCYYLEDVVYCATPSNPDLQCMNLFVPENYISADGTLIPDAGCGAYTARTAPIVIQSAVMGYSEVAPAMLQVGSRIPDQKLAEQFLQAGMIYVSVGVRGRQTQGEDGSYVGKAPALVADAKAAIRFYRHNKAVLPGNTERIVFVGVSAGGNLASLIGTTGNHPYFSGKLRQMEAVMDESDAVYAVQAFCPITDLEHADMAYEWMFQGKYTRNLPPFLKDKSNQLTEFQKAFSQRLGRRYLDYVNGLKLTEPVSGAALTLNGNGRSGSLYDYLMQKLEDAATVYCKYLENDPAAPDYSVRDYICGNYTVMQRGPQGMTEKPGLDKRNWLSWDGERAHITSLDDMEKDYVERMKDCPSFDSLELSEFENEEFGSENQRVSHFNGAFAGILEELKEAFPEEYDAYYGALSAVCEDELIKEQIYALNPLNFIQEEDAQTLCEHYRIRVGSMDAHTSFSTAALIALSLQNAGKKADFEFTWEKGHGVCDYDGALCEWIRSICQP